MGNLVNQTLYGDWFCHYECVYDSNLLLSQHTSVCGKVDFISLDFMHCMLLDIHVRPVLLKGWDKLRLQMTRNKDLSLQFPTVLLLFLVNAGLSFFLTTMLAPKYEGGLLNPVVWQKIVFIAVGIQIFFTVLAILGIWEKDRTEYFGFGQKNDAKFSFKEFGRILVGNKGLRYLMISANTEKIG